MKFARFAGTLCWNIGTFGANLSELFPDLCIWHSKIGEETSKSGARMNRFDRDGVITILLTKLKLAGFETVSEVLG